MSKDIKCLHCHRRLTEPDGYKVCPYCGIHITWKLYRWTYSFENNESVIFIKENNLSGAKEKLERLILDKSKWNFDMKERNL